MGPRNRATAPPQDTDKDNTHGEKHGSTPSNASSEEQKPPSRSPTARLKQLWARIGIDKRTAMQMFKASLGPAIGICAYQSDAWADTFTTVGYLVAITTSLSMVTVPRAKFIQTMVVNVIFICVACAVGLLAMYCCVKARLNSTGAEAPGDGGPGTSGLAAGGAETAPYNSSASAVAGVWLFAEIYVISVLRAKYVQWSIPAIIAAIFINVQTVYAPQFNTMAQAESFAQKLLQSFLTGFAIAAAVSILVFPLSSRQVLFQQMRTYVTSLRGALAANLDYLHSLETSDMFATPGSRASVEGASPQGTHHSEAERFKGKIRELSASFAKIQADLPFAKRELAFGKLGPDDLQNISRLFRDIMTPAMGLSCVSDIFQRIAEERGWDKGVDHAHTPLRDAESPNEGQRIQAIFEWHALIKSLREPFDEITKNIDEGLEHVSLTLQLSPASPKPDRPSDPEAEGGEPRPGSPQFADFFLRRTKQFLESKKLTLKGWCLIHDIDLPDDFFENPEHAHFQAPEWMNTGHLSLAHRRMRRQLFLCLYIEYLLVNMSRRTHDLILLADGFRASGKLSKTRLIVPGFKRMRKWFLSVLSSHRDVPETDEHAAEHGLGGAVFLGEAYRSRRDPEHLPPANNWEHFGNQFRKIAHFFHSPAAGFALRVSCATMVVGVIALLEDTQVWATRNRIFWAQIMVSIGLSPSAGQSLRNLILRIGATVLALFLSWIAWYIVDGRTAGVLVFMFVFLNVGSYIIVKYPMYIPAGLVVQITILLIIGYELQVRKVGIDVATSNGQAYYPIYELGPIRLAEVCAGLFVAWIFSIFPYPVSEHNQMRQKLGSALYLLANYYSIMHECVRVRLSGEDGSGRLAAVAEGRQLEKSRNKVLTKTNFTLAALRAQSAFLKFDIPIGGKFPVQRYQRLVTHMQSLLNYMSLVTAASLSFHEIVKDNEAASAGQALRWITDLRQVVRRADSTSQQITTILSVLSASVTNSQPVPPYLRVPEVYALAAQLDEIDHDILNVAHIAEPGYSIFAVIHIGTRFLIDDLKSIVTEVKGLVGELDFSYHVVSSPEGMGGKGDEDRALLAHAPTGDVSIDERDAGGDGDAGRRKAE